MIPLIHMEAQNKDTSPVLPILALLGAVLFWGASFTAGRVAVAALRPMSVMWLRMAIGAILLLPFIRRLRLSEVRKKDLPIIGLYVLLMPGFYYLFETNALRFTTAGQAGVISAVVPLFIAVGAFLFLKEPLSITTIIGLIVSIGGTAVLSLLGSPNNGAENPLLGNSLELGAMVCAAVSMVIIKHLSSRYSPWTLTALQIFGGFIFFSPGAFFLFASGPVRWDPVLIGSILFLGSFVTLGAFGLYNWGLSKLSAAKASIFINLIPVVAVAIGWSLLGEALNWVQIIAAGGILAGVAISQRRSRPLLKRAA